MNVVCGWVYDEYEEAWRRDGDKSEGEVPVVRDETRGGIGAAGEGVEGGDGFRGIHAAGVSLGLCVCVTLYLILLNDKGKFLAGGYQFVMRID